MRKWAILLTLIAVLLLVLGSMSCSQGSSGREKLQTEQQYVQLAEAVFYSDVHSGWKDMNGDDNSGNATSFDDNVWGRLANDTAPGYYYPTAIARAENHFLTASITQADPKHRSNPLMLGYSGHAATDCEIQAHAIWMGLLVNAPGTYVSAGGTTSRGNVSVLSNETAMYLQTWPRSASSVYNGVPSPGGSYVYVICESGSRYTVYKSTDGNWYAGFNGKYP